MCPRSARSFCSGTDSRTEERAAHRVPRVLRATQRARRHSAIFDCGDRFAPGTSPQRAAAAASSAAHRGLDSPKNRRIVRHLAGFPALFQSRPSHEPHRPPATQVAREALRLRRLRMRAAGPARHRWQAPHRYHQLIFRLREIGDPDLPEATRTPSGSHPGAFCFQRSRSAREHQHTRGPA